MIPGVGTVTEMKALRDLVSNEAERIIKASGVKVPYQVGTMIEMPRACMVAHRIAEHAEFFSFGTNDLTQTVFGYSRDDAEGSFIPVYLDEEDLARRSIPSHRPRRRRRDDAHGDGARPHDAPGYEDRHLRRARRRSEVGGSSATTSDWTTSRARRSECPSRASPRRRSSCARDERTRFGREA